MSRISKWKPEKTKTKVVFRLQFHATHIPQTGWDKLFVSFVPADSGKATAKTTKANVRNGTCKWADPIYETTRLLQDVRTKQYDEKLYKLVVAMGSSRSSLLGEATINLAEFGDALKPSSVALSLQGCDSGATLHVTVQLLTSKTGFREFEQQRELRERGLSTTSDQNGRNEFARATSSEETEYARFRSKSELRGHPLNEEEVGLSEEHVDSPTGFDVSSNTSGSLYAEKHDTSSAHEIDSIKSTVSGDVGGLSLNQSPQPEKTFPSDQRHVGTSDWVHGWGSDYSADNDLAITYEENNRLRGSLEVAESSLNELKLEVSSLQSHADSLGAEAQKFAQQLAAEMASGENLSREVAVLKSECSKFKAQIEMLKIDKISSPYSGRESVGIDQDQDLKLRCFRGLLLVEDKVREIQNKTCFGFHDRDFRFLGSDLEALLVLLQDLKQGTGQAITRISFATPEGGGIKQAGDMCLNETKKLASQLEFGTDLYQPESMLHHLTMSGLSHDSNPADVTDAMKDRIVELVRELDESKAERESLSRKMDQMECYYEALVQELEGNQRHMLGELQNLRNEHTACLYAVSTTNAEMERMRQDMNEQLQRFSEEKHELDSLNKELERRAVTAEAALKRARLNYSIAVNQLQKDLELLSVQVSSMHEANENLIRQAIEDSAPPSLQGVLAYMQNQKTDTSSIHEARLLSPQNLPVLQKKQLGGDILLDDLRKSLYLQEELYQKVEQEVFDAHLKNVFFDVFSKTLQETLRDASADFEAANCKMDNLMKQLELAYESKDELMQKLESALDDVRSLSDYKETCSLKCTELSIQNQLLESNLHSATTESYSLAQKIKELESLMSEYRSYKHKYETADAERIELSNQLGNEIEESIALRKENLALKGEMRILQDEIKELLSVKQNLQSILDILQEKLHNLMVNHYDNDHGELLSRESDNQGTKAGDLISILSHLEESQRSMCNKHFQLMEERKALENERNVALTSLSTSESNVLLMKQKFEHDLRDMLDKLGISNSIVHKLQLQVETLADRLELSSEDEERHEKQHIETLTTLHCLELELEQLMLRNEDISQKVQALEIINEELDHSKSIIAECTKEKHALMASIQSKSEESSQLELIVGRLKDDRQSQQSELDSQRSYIEKLEIRISDLTSQLNEKHYQLLNLDELRAEVVHLKQLVSNLELEKTQLFDLLSHSEERLRVSCEESSSLADLENLLVEMQEYVISVGIQLIYTRVQYEVWTADILQQLQFSDRQLDNLQQYNLVLESRLNCCLTNEAHQVEENAKLLARLESCMSDLETSIAQNRELQNANDVLRIELEKQRKTNETMDVYIHEERMKHAESVESLKSALEASAAQNRILHDTNDALQNEIEQHKMRNEAQDASICEERARHAESLESLRSDLETCTAHNTRLQDVNVVLTTELEELRKRNEMVEAAICEEKKKLAESIGSLRSELEASVAQTRELHGINIALMAELEEHKKTNELRDANFGEERGNQAESLCSLKSDLEASIVRNRELDETNNELMVELDEIKKRWVKLDAWICEERTKHSIEAGRLMSLLATSEEELDRLMLLNEELQVRLLIFIDKLQEQSLRLTLLEGCKIELAVMQKQCAELTQRLSEQVLKTEEFKNLAIHLRELKEKADAESLHARDKKESDGPPFVMQESLRIAFIKEQYETRLQELKHQLSISKKHSEELLCKLQDALDELENRKKSEVSYLKRNEELGAKISELESDLQEAVSEKREKMKAFDCMKAEMECSLISLECCKEEKQKLEASLLECNEEKSKVQAELNLVKELLDHFKAPLQKDVSANLASLVSSDEREVVEPVHGDNRMSLRYPKHLSSRRSLGSVEADACSDLDVEDAHVSGLDTIQSKQDLLASGGGKLIQNLALVDRENTLHNERKDLTLVNDHFKVQALMSSMENLNNELEKMKNENWLLHQEDHNGDSKFPELQRELMQLNKANEELGSIFPLFNDFSGSGNALERVLALEIELAEALQAKKRSTIQFQSSFLRQHGDEEAILKSFRDINELIKDMLELKGKYASVESELKEMHERYSQLSLQFAEVEGERQKLMMTLKCVRSSRKAASLNRSSSADHSF